MKTKVLYVAMKFDYGDKSRGISFEHRNFHDSMKTYAEKQDWEFVHYDFLTRAQEIGQAAMTEELYETVKREKPTVLFAVLCDAKVDPYYEVFERISGLGTVTVHWFCDDHWRFEGYSSYVAPSFDLVCTTASSSLPKYQQLGLSDRVIKTQWACNHELYVPFDIPRDIDCSFVGMPHGDRINVLNSLSSQGLDVQIYGYGWQYRPRLPFNQMVRMFSRSKVNLNLANSAVSSVQQIKGRNFEVPGCRAFLLTAKAEELDSYFEDGREVVTYDTLDDLVEKAHYYAAHDEEREIIAQNAYTRTLAEHTWHHRYDVVFEKALAIQPRPYVAPVLSIDADFLPGSGKPNFTSIIILNLNGAKHIHDCIDSLRRYTKPAHEIIVVDNGSTDDSLDYLRALPFVKLIENKENVGVGLGRNQGLAVAEGEYIVFLDNDTIVTDAWLDRFINYAKADQSIGMMGPRSNYVSGPQVVPDAKYSSFEEMQAFGADWASKNSMQATLVGRLVGFCQFIRRAVIKKVGGTEPAFGLWGWDDDDLSLRAQLAGYKLAMANEIYIHHTGSQTSKTADLNYNELLVEKWEIFRQKWGLSWTPGQPMAYSVEQILLRRFDPNKHGIALPTQGDIESLVYPRLVTNVNSNSDYYSLSPTCQLPNLANLYSKYLGDKPDGTFVEIGANDGETVSNTSGLADIGWKGFYVEPIPKEAELCRNRHASNNIVVDTMAIGKEIGTLTLFEAVSESVSALCTSVPEMRDFYKENFTGQTIEAQMLTLDNYLETRELTPGFDLLTIDTEGTEWDVIQGFAVEKWQPRMIIVELHENNAYYSQSESLRVLQTATQNKVHARLDPMYDVVYSDCINTVFVLKEIIKKLYPKSESLITSHQTENSKSSSMVEDLLMTKRWDDAIEAINEHLRSNPDDARSLNKLGMAYHGKGDDKSARNAVRRSIDADPTYADAYYGMAQLLLNDNRAIEAADYAIKAAGFGVPHYGAMKTLEDCRKALRTVKQTAGKKQGKKAKNTSVAVADIDTRLRKLGEMIECVATQPESNTGPKQTISLCMIARNEEDMIGDSLASVKDLVDEIVVVDTGSTDRTVQIAETYGAKITNFEWNDCFADARNVAIEQATSDWVLVLDADERLDDNARNQIAQAISNSETDAYELAFVNYMTGANTPDVHISRCVRLFRNRPTYRYIGRIHERIAPAIQNTGGIIRLLEAVIHHHGYRPEIVKERGKHQRNLNLLEKDLADSPQDVYVIYHLANQYYTEGNHAKAVEYFEQCVPLVLPTHQFKPLLFSNLADCYMALGQLQDAIKAIDNASLLRAYHPQLLHSKGNTFRLAGNYPLAVDSYEAAIELGKRGLWDGDTTTFGYKAHYGAAASYLAIGHYTMAIEHAEKALLSRPGNPESVSVLAQAKDALAANGGQNKEVYESSRTQVHSGDNPKLSLCMIVKDEEEFLKGCLNSARPIVDEIIVVDTGSKDRTVEIATECGANVHYFPWNDSFADARNESLNHATGDWILILDADELLDDAAPSIILDAIKNPTADAYEMFFRNPIGEEKDSDYTEHRICRLFRNKTEYRFNSRIHENIETAVGQNHGTIGQLQAVIHHMGYVQRLIVERNKGERYTKILEQEVAEHPGNIFYMHHLIAAYCAYGQFEKALENLFVATEIAELNNPFTPILWATLVNILVELGRPDEALDAAERSETRGVYQHPQLHFCKANAYTRLERYQEAVDSYKKAIEEGRGKTWNGDTQTAGYKADYGIGNSYQKMNRNDEAIPYLLKAIDTKPNHIAANEALTKAYSATNQMDKYEKQLAVLQTLVPKDPGPSIRLAELCEGRQEIDKARDIYMNIIANIEDTAVLEFKLGSFHEALGDNESAEKCYLRAIEILPECKDAHSNLGLLLASQGRLEEALDSFVRAIDIDPNYANAYFNAGDVLYQAGLYEQSLDIYSNGLEIIPDHVPAFFAIGNCYFQLGAYEAATVAYRETLKLEPGHTGATNNMSLAEAALQEAPVESETPEASNVA